MARKKQQNRGGPPIQPIADEVDGLTRFVLGVAESDGWSNAAIARAIGVRPQRVTDWRQGRRRATAAHLSDIAQVLGIVFEC